MGNRKKP